MTFWTCWSKGLFPLRSTKMIDGATVNKMIDGSKEQKHQPAFELEFFWKAQLSYTFVS